MATTLTATPNLSTASVLLKVDMAAEDLPLTKYELNLSNFIADASQWKPAITIWGYNSTFFNYRNLTGEGMVRTITGLIVGRRYLVSFRTAYTVAGQAVGVNGKFSMTLTDSAIPTSHSIEMTATATSHNLYFKSTPVGSEFESPDFMSLNVSLLPVIYSGETFTLTRTDANGVRPVRLLPGQRVMDSGLIIEDFEAAIVGDVTYSFTAPNGTRVSTSTSLAGAQPALAPAVFPQYGVQDVFVTGYDASRGTGAVVHEVIGRADPVVRLQPMRTRRGTLTVWANDYAALGRAVDVYRRGEVILFRQATHSGMDLYHVATDVHEGAYDEQFKRWRLDVTYIEVPSPLGPVLGSLGWTWDSLAAAFPTWDAATAYFATWNDLQIGLSS